MADFFNYLHVTGNYKNHIEDFFSTQKSKGKEA